MTAKANQFPTVAEAYAKDVRGHECEDRDEQEVEHRPVSGNCDGAVVVVAFVNGASGQIRGE